MRRARRPPVTVLAVSLSLASCLLPTDRSADLRVELDAPPLLFVKDSVRLTGRLVDAAGDTVPNAALAFSSSDPTVVSVDPDGRLLAVGVGTAEVSAVAIALSDAAPGTQSVRVRGRLAVDSLAPRDAAFGALLTLYGVGLDPDSLFTVTLGGIDAPIAWYVAEDAAQPNKLGRLAVWVPPPAAPRSVLTVLAFSGGVTFPDTIAVAQEDVYEPNDTTPAALGELPDELSNPALAFEVRPRDQLNQAADWYTFTNAAETDRTISVSSPVGPESYGLMVSNSLDWSNSARQPVVTAGGWGTGPDVAVCRGGRITDTGGATVTFAQVRSSASVIALKALPAGTYHVLIPYVSGTDPSAYHLVIAPRYASVLPPDVAEENDYCDGAKDLSVAQGQTLTIDNPGDVDWFRFTLAVKKTVMVTVSAPAPASGQDAPDLDLYLIRDNGSGSLQLVTSSASQGLEERLTAPAVNPGDYYLVVVDFAGVPTTYTMTSSLTAPVQ